jgi:LAS superfamily LD-carboxypeptidase LdcB
VRNGRLPKRALRRVYHPRYKVYLAKRAAIDWTHFRKATKRRVGRSPYPLGKDSAYRSYRRQVYYWALYKSGRGNLAAYPGTSNHGWGKAVDLAAPWMRQAINVRGARFRWRKTEAFSEWWHINSTR